MLINVPTYVYIFGGEKYIFKGEIFLFMFVFLKQTVTRQIEIVTSVEVPQYNIFCYN